MFFFLIFKKSTDQHDVDAHNQDSVDDAHKLI